MNLTTLAKLKEHIGIPSSNTDKDSLLASIITGVSSFIEEHTHRKFAVTEYTEIIDGGNFDEIFLKQYPIREVLTLTINSAPIDLDSGEEDGTIIITKESGAIYKASGFGSGRKAVKIVYTAGYNDPSDEEESGDSVSSDYEDLPVAIQTAATRLAARVYERRTAEGVSSTSAGSFSVQYKDAVDSDVSGVLDSYKKIRI